MEKCNLNKVKLNKSLAFLAGMFSLIAVFSCSKDKEGENGDATKHTLTITKPTGGNITSDAGGISCGSKGTTCEAKFDKGTEVTLTAKADTGYIPGAWQGACAKTEADQVCKLSMDTDMAAGLTLAIDPNDIDGDGEPNETDVDDDGDGLIEIHNLDMFNYIRYNLAGTSYKTGADAEANTRGAPVGSPTANCKTATDGVYLCGYELMRDLDFNEDSSYATGSTNKSVWQPNNSDTSMATNEGFVGIDSGFGIEENIPSIFEGNGHTISNLYSRNTDDMSPGDGKDMNPIARVGLFKSTEAKATIRNLGVVDARLYGSASDYEQIGSLVSKNKGTILACHATGEANGGDGVDTIGGLVGTNTAGTGTAAGAIIDSHATVAVDGGNAKDRVGGLVGLNRKGSIRGSYATGAVTDSAGDKQDIGGLAGYNTTDGSITASYATGAAIGGNETDYIGGLVGRNDGNITGNYATGAVNGNVGDGDYVGGLVGRNEGSITGNYASGAANGGAGLNDNVGGLAGNNDGSITGNYASGAANGGARGYDYVGGLVGRNKGGIVASFATGSATAGNNGMDNDVGSLVGVNEGTITASYATGNANGGADKDDDVGGLVGRNKGGIVASYATGNANGGAGDADFARLLAGSHRTDRNTIMASYGFGIKSGGEHESGDNDGSDGDAHPTGIQSISGKANKVNALTAPGGGANTDVDPKWNNAGQKTLNVWDFGTNSQAPALKYADYDGTGDTYSCDMFPAKIPGTNTDLQCGVSLLPGQGR